MERSYSFRVYTNHQRKLNEMSEYFQNASRNELIRAAIQLFHDRPDLYVNMAKQKESSKLTPSDACIGLLRLIMENAYKQGRTGLGLEFIQGGCVIIVPCSTRTEFVPPYTMEFQTSKNGVVHYQLSLDANYVCLDVTTGRPVTSEQALKKALNDGYTNLLMRIQLDSSHNN